MRISPGHLGAPAEVSSTPTTISNSCFLIAIYCLLYLPFSEVIGDLVADDDNLLEVVGAADGNLLEIVGAAGDSFLV